MPHSLRYPNGRIYVCESGRGKVLSVDPDTGEVSDVINLQGFTRGLSFHGPLMFLGLSKIRVSDIKNPIPISKEYEETYSGVWIINLEENKVIAHIKFTGNVDQIYDLAIIPDSVYPELLTRDSRLIRHSFDFQEAL